MHNYGRCCSCEYVVGVKGEREVRTFFTEQGNAPRRRRGVDENTGRNRSCCCSCRLDRSLRQTASRVQTQSATRQWRTVLSPRQLRAIISCGNDGPNLIGCRGMGSEIGAGLSRTRTGPKFIKAPIFNNLILIKKTSTGSDCEFLAALNDSVGGLN